MLPAAPGNRWKATLQRSGYQCIGAQPYAEMLGFEALLDIPGLYSGQKAVLVRFLEHFEILPPFPPKKCELLEPPLNRKGSVGPNEGDRNMIIL